MATVIQFPGIPGSASFFRRLPRSRDLRVLFILVLAVAVFGIVDGTFWKSLPSPTLGYRPAILFAFTLLFGWRGLLWSQVLFIAAFLYFFSWQGAALLCPLYLVAHAGGLVVTRRLAANERWLCRERSTFAFLIGGALAAFLSASLKDPVIRILGIAPVDNVPTTLSSWLREGSAIVALVPAVLVYGSGRLKEWAGWSASREWPPISVRDVVEVGSEMAAWAASLWLTIHVSEQYGLNITYLAFLPLLLLTVRHGMRLAVLALAGNAVVATVLWSRFDWERTLQAGDLRLLIGFASITTLMLATVVDERERGRAHIQRLRTAKAALRESENYFHTLADTAPVMIWVADPDKAFTFVNKPWLAYTGRSIEQEIGDGWIDSIHAEDADRCLRIYRTAFDQQCGFQMTGRFQRADGEYRWILSNGVPLYRDEQFAGFIGSSIDITDQKVASEALQASQTRLAYAQRLAQIGGFERDVESGVMQWSEEKLRILGLSHAPSSFAESLALVHPGDKQKFLEIEGRVRSSSGPVEVEYRIVRPDGDVRVLRSIVEGIKNDQGKLARVVGATQDITAHVQARERLQESEQRLRSAQQLAHVGSWNFDLESNRVFCSEECTRIFGQPGDFSPTLEGLLEGVMLDDRERLAHEIKNMVKTRREHSTEVKIVRPGGELRTVIFTLRVLGDEEGVCRQIFGACQDVTDARRVQHESLSRQKLETVGTLANGIAHDFNNLLGGIIAQAETALSELATGARPEEELKTIRDISVRGAEIVRQLMIYAGTGSVDIELLDLSHSVDRMLALLKITVSKHARIETNLGQGLPSIRANPAQISQVVMNLVANASEAIGDRDGLIRVTTSRGDEDLGRGREALMEGPFLQLEVSDTGSGMTFETRGRVFDPFFSTKAAGRGLGLAVVHGIVRSLGGSIRLMSEPGTGTTIQIGFPCDLTGSETEQVETNVSGQLDADRESSSLLIVEDEEALRQAVAKLLRKRGWSVLEAGDGSAALQIIRTHPSPIGVLLLDITLPGIASREVFEEVQLARPETKVIITSAYSESLAARTFRRGTYRFLRKPFQLNDLVGLMQATWGLESRD